MALYIMSALRNWIQKLAFVSEFKVFFFFFLPFLVISVVLNCGNLALW